MKKWVSVLMPLFLGAIVYAITLICKVPALHFLRFEFLLNVIITCSVTISGFILTAVSILVSAGSSKIVQKMRASDTMQELRLCYTETLLIGFWVIIFFTAMGAIVGEDNLISSALVSICTAVLVTYLSSILITGYFLLSVINLINDVPPEIDNHGSSPTGDYR